MQKKATLLKHFTNYLVEQQKKMDGDDGGGLGKHGAHSAGGYQGHQVPCRILIETVSTQLEI